MAFKQTERTNSGTNGQTDSVQSVMWPPIETAA